MALEVTIIKAENLINLEKIGKSDPLVILEFQGAKKKTNVVSNNLNPEWNEKFIWETGKHPPSPDDSLCIFVKDYERVGRNRLMGETTLLLRNVLESSQPLEYELTLFDHNQRPTAGTLFLVVGYSKPEKRPLPEKSSQDTTDGGAKTEANLSSIEATQTSDVLRRDVFNITLPNQRTKFQVRVRVVEGRHLVGSNINPICQVILSQLPKQTEVVKATSNPYWNDVFFFHIEFLPLDLYKEILEFKVQNGRAFRSNMLIGSFKIDLGQIYSQRRHTYFNKWLVLSNEEDEDSVAEIMGYLKVSVAVIGPGDETPDLSVDTDSEKDDVESNLLLPTGTQLKPATFHIDLFQAADLPRMDPGVMEGVKKILNIEDKKELIDPYLEVAFAGHKVASRIIYGNDNPRWNERMFLGFQFPSVCDNIQLILKDWDRVSEDDVVAVADIPVPKISASGTTGFLPCFGPAWVNFYGAPREYKVMRSKLSKLNEGAAEGCSFRGRALISIKTDLGSYPDAKSGILPADDVLRVQFYCRTRRFRLHATFLDATMVNITDTPVEFEVSLGNYGNKFEDRFTPSPSTTPPTNAVFDGCQYYYLPWKNVKPSLIVTSQWEDTAFRLETLNLLLKVIENMENEIETVKSRGSHAQILDYQDTIISLVNKFLHYTNISLPEPVPGQQKENELDRLLRRRRIEEISNLREQAKILRESGSDVTEAIQELESMVQEIKNMTFEPQNNIPDVIVWMLTGNKRIAYKRISVHQILFSPDATKSGKYCGKVQTLLLKDPRDRRNKKIPAVLRVKLWFGLEIYEKYWKTSEEVADLTAYAETYENQVNVLGKWITKGPTMTRPAWSDSSGNIKLHPEKFVLPIGWRFDGDWFIDPEPSLKYEDDAGRRTFLEDVFENQNRLPGGPWIAATTTWTDIRGDPANPRDAIECPPGWDWHDVWEVDLHRAVDEEGWEYTIEATLGGYQPVEKTYHLCKRRRWVRQRNFIGEAESPEEGDTSNEALLNNDGGWEYSTLFTMRFHAKRRRMDLVRRRRWHRKLVTDDKSPYLAFSVLADTEKSNDDSKLSLLSCPVLSMEYKVSHRVQMRAYVYQARDLIAGDKTGFSDPYAFVSFLNQSQKTEIMYKTLCPAWDQTLIFDGFTIYGDLTEIKEQPPLAVVEVYDRDAHGDDEFLGRVLVIPRVQLDATSIRSPPLKWHPLDHPSGKAGEILASFELFVVDGDRPSPRVPPKRGNVFIVPAGIRPVVQLTAIEVLCWGIRNMKTFELSPISSPSVEFDCGGKVVQSKRMKDAKQNPNFENPVLYLEMLLPQEPQYMPPLNIKVRDHRQFGRKPVVGTCVIKSLHDYFCQPFVSEVGDETIQQSDAVDTVIEIPSENPENSEKTTDATVDWWAKYYASVGDVSKSGKYLQQGYDTLQVFHTELEKVPPYNGFSDFLNTFPLKRGKTKVLEESNCVGEFKGTFRVYPLPSDPDKPRPQKMLKTLPRATKEEIVVRLYVIKAQDLAPKDPNGKADPYIAVKLGKKKLDNRKNYKPNTLCPVFGEVFELSGTLPLDKDLTISVWDYDLLNADDLIGNTVIDLENRYLTKYRATCGLPLSYHVSGVNKWRDSKKPSEILEDICILHHVPLPQFIGLNTVVIGKTSYTLDDFEKQAPENAHVGPAKQRLALYVLHSMTLVPEHVETRALYNPLSPGLQQGKLQMWVDIFPKSHGQPGPRTDVTPRNPLKYQLRAIIWNTYEVPLDERSVVGGENMSDIYVKCWLQGDDSPQKTDVHYRSMDGEGNFNWRMIFPFAYLPAENNIVVTRKKHFWSLDATEQHLPPKFCIQIWDNDIFSPDDFLGSLEFPLTALPEPAKSADKCGLHQLGIEEGCTDILLKMNSDNLDGKAINIFEKKRIKGFWPCFTKNPEKGYCMAGKVEMELEILSEEEAAQKPAGVGRDEPNMNPKLEMPNRPSTSFLWLTSPWKSFKFILWRNYKWYCITLLLIFLAVLLVIIFIYSFPEALAQRLVN